jgi:hypothetical protein
VVAFTAPRSGGYVFDTLGSSFDTVLAVYDGVCEGRELDCSDDSTHEFSQVELYLSTGQQVSLVVDGYGGAEGRFVLTGRMLDEGSCCEAAPRSFGCAPFEVARCVCEAMPDCCSEGWNRDCAQAVLTRGCGSCTQCPQAHQTGPLPSVFQGTTVGLSDLVTLGCGAAQPSGDYAVAFTAPYAGTFSFDTFGSSLDTVLAVRDNDCAGEELDCNDDAIGLQSQVILHLSEGQTVAVIVDGYYGNEGDFVLNIREVGDASDCCTATPGIRGCPDPTISECVCARSLECCDTEWSEACVVAVEILGCGTCPLFPL